MHIPQVKYISILTALYYELLRNHAYIREHRHAYICGFLKYSI